MTSPRRGDAACITPTPATIDVGLADAVRSGDTAAFAELYQSNRGPVLGYAHTFTRCSSAAEDLMSEAFLGTYSALHNGDGPRDNVRSYLFAAVRSAAARMDRRLTFIENYFDTALTPAPSPADLYSARFDRSRAGAAYRQLPERWRTVLMLTVLEGQSSAAAGKQLGLTANTAAALAHRARKGLRRVFAQLPEDRIAQDTPAAA